MDGGEPLRICIYGAGSLGTVLGAYLSRAGLDVDLVTRNRSHVEAMNLGGAMISGTVEMTVPVKAMIPETMHGIYDYIFLLTKQQENEKVVALLRNFLSPEGALCTFQNGLPEYEISRIIGKFHRRPVV